MRAGVRRLAKVAAWGVRDRLGRGAGRLGVLVYHRVAEEEVGVPGMTVHPRTFRAQLEALSRHGDVRPLPEAVAAWGAGALDRPTICVSFDDGYVDNAEVAVPIAQQVGVPLTLFISTGALGAPGFWWDRLWAVAGSRWDASRFWDMQAGLRRLPAAAREARLDELQPGEVTWGRPMTRVELQAVAGRPGVTIGSHTVSHPRLSALTEADQMAEIRGAHDDLRSLLGMDSGLVAYPFGKAGDVSATTEAVARRAGLVAGFTTQAGVATRSARPFALPRLSVHEWPDHAFDSALGAAFGTRRRG